jgi:hypothetical protein
MAGPKPARPFRQLTTEIDVTSRAETSTDAAAAAEVYLRARHSAAPAIPPLAHRDDQMREWFRNVVVPPLETWLAEDAAELVGLMVLHRDELEQLSSTRRGWAVEWDPDSFASLSARDRTGSPCGRSS